VLLLVLVLVLIAFGLLVVALLSGSVMWAWISVAVSVAAAVALLVDWWQRRSAVRAGAEPEQVAGVPPQAAVGPPPAYRGVGDIDPVTEVIPVVPQGAPGGVTEADAASTRPASDAEATSVMPLVEPSGSAGRPPGAEDAVTRSSGSSSPSVTTSEDETEVSDPAREAGEERAEGAATEAELEGAAPRDEQGPGRAGGSAAAGPAGSPAGADTGGEAGEHVGSVDGPTVATPAAAGHGAHEAHEAPGAHEVHGVPGAHEAHGAHEAREQATGPEGAVTEARADRPSGAAAGLAAGAAGAAGVVARVTGLAATQNGDDAPRGGQDATGTPAQQPPGQHPAGVPAGQAPGHQAGQPPAGSLPPPGPHGEPPEEPRDGEIAALVAELDDEVVVVDEQPRYHLAGCRSLPGRSVIPLPAKEAVELGFTPCGWCTPDRTMAGRHQPAAH